MIEIVLPIDEPSVFGRRLRVDHSATALERGLSIEELVVLRDADDDRRFLATITDVDFTLEDTHYELRVEGALAAAVADRYVDGAGELTTEDIGLLVRGLARPRMRVVS